MTEVGVRELRNRTADLVSRAHAGEDIIVTSHGTPMARLAPLRDELKPYLTKSDLLTFPLADSGLRADLEDISGDSTDDLGAIE